MGFKEKSNCIKDSVYIDDGFSGTHFDNRPQFTEMIGLAQKGEINCIIVKDFSRFGRDYVELGNYLEQLFPFMGVRFISVKLERVIVEGKHQPIVTKEEYERVQKMMAEKDAQMGQRRKNKGVHSDDLWRRKMRCQCGHAFAKTKWHTKTDFITYTYKCYDQTRTGTIAARLKNGLSIEGVCRSPLVQDWKMYTMAQKVLHAVFDDLEGTRLNAAAVLGCGITGGGSSRKSCGTRKS